MRKKTRKKELISTFSFGFLITILSCLVVVLVGSALLLRKTNDNPYCANSISCIKDLSGKFSTDKIGIFMGKTVEAPQQPASLADIIPAKNTVLGAATVASPEKHIYVDLTNQRLYAFEGSKLVFDDVVSTGKWGITPTGTFKIWIKLRATRMTGGSVADGTFYDLPNVEYTMFFYNDETPKSLGYSLHAAYWHNNFGHPMSHGCVNMKTTDAKALFDWADPVTTGYTTYATDKDPGTFVTIYGTPPAE